MTDPRTDADEPHHSGLPAVVRRERGREARALAGRALGGLRGLAAVGMLGWLIVVPTLAGLFVGRWVDRRLGSGITLTGALLVVGLAVGCRLAWTRMHRS